MATRPHSLACRHAGLAAVTLPHATLPHGDPVPAAKRASTSRTTCLAVQGAGGEQQACDSCRNGPRSQEVPSGSCRRS